MKVYGLLIAFFLCLIGSEESSHAAEILVFAAVSLTEALKECASNYQQTSRDTVDFCFGGSNDLARQIEAGAPADLFFSADEAKMDNLEKKGRLVQGTRRSLLSNHLVIVIPSGAATKISDPTQLADGSFVRTLALANSDVVPAGIYAKEYLKKINIWEKVSTKVIPTESVRACLAAVESKNADAGIVYKTDALISKETEVAYEVPASETPEISYPLAVIKESANIQGAAKFAGYLASAEAAKIFEKHGFTVKE
jgi:molybdate transport system substrate-binding protein